MRQNLILLRRKIEETFIKWRNTEDRLPLIVEGQGRLEKQQAF